MQRFLGLFLTFGVASFTAACAGDDGPPSGPDGVVGEDTFQGDDVLADSESPDAEPDAEPDAGLDAGPDADPDTSGDASADIDDQDTTNPGDTTDPGDTSDPGDTTLPERGSIEAPPAVVTRKGAGGFLLRGVVLAPEGPIPDGEVLVVNDRIVCVATSCDDHPQAGGVTVIDTHGVISPGLVDSHNHITYNFLPEWEPGRFFDNRDIWSDDPSYEAHVAPFADGRNNNDRVCPAGKWGEIRSIIHGTTTVQGQSFNRSCLNRLARNADHHHGLGYDHFGTDIASPADLTTTAAITLAQRFSNTNNGTTRYAIHMCEGLRGSKMDIEFESWAGRDPRTHLARHQGLSLLAHEGTWTNPATGTSYEFFYRGVMVLIHSLLLTEAQLQEVVATDSFVVWSPSSNLALYGATAPIERMLELNIPVGIGPDWTPSGEDELLGEMRAARRHGDAEGVDLLTPARIWKMATSDGAEVMGLGDVIGQLHVDYKADITVFGRLARDPYEAVIDSKAADVRLVMIDGRVYYGDGELHDDVALNGDCEVLDACGHPKFVCVRNTPGHTDRAGETVADLRQQLTDLLALYDRADELNELIACE